MSTEPLTNVELDELEKTVSRLRDSGSRANALRLIAALREESTALEAANVG